MPHFDAEYLERGDDSDFELRLTSEREIDFAADHTTDFQSPKAFPTLRQNLIQAIRHGDHAALSELVSSHQNVADSINELSDVPRHEWPQSPLSIAVQLGDLVMVEILLHSSHTPTFREAIKFEEDVLLPEVESSSAYFNPENGHLRYGERRRSSIFDYDKEVHETQSNPSSPSEPLYKFIHGRVTQSSDRIRDVPEQPCLRREDNWSIYGPKTKDSTSLALRALLFSEGDGQALFMKFRNRHLSLKGAQFCDIGRTLWFWAAQKGFTEILDCFLEDGFPIDFRATGTQYGIKSGPFTRTSEPGYDPAPVNTTALWNGAKYGSTASVEFLLRRGALMNHKLIKLEGELTKKSIASQYAESDSGSIDEEIQVGTVQQAKAYLQTVSNTNNQRSKEMLSEIISVTSRLKFGFVNDESVSNELLAASQGVKAAWSRHKHWEEYEEMYSTLSNYAQVLHLLLKNGSDPNVQVFRSDVSSELPSKAETIPHVIAPILQFAHLGAISAVRFLLEYGARTDVTDDDARTLLHYAARSQNEELIKLSLDYNVAVNSKAHNWYNPLHECVLHGTQASLELLLSKGADPNSLTDLGMSPLLMAMNLRNFRAAELLLKYGADPNYSLKPSKAFFFSGKLGNSELEERFAAGTPLLAAMVFHYVDAKFVQVLLDHGADPQLTGFIASKADRPKKRRDRFGSPNRWSPEWGWHLEAYKPVQYAVSMFKDKLLYDKDLDQFKNILKALLDTVQRRSTSLEQVEVDYCLRSICTPRLENDWSRQKTDFELDRFAAPLKAINLLLDYGGNPKTRGNSGMNLLHLVCSKRPPGPERWGFDFNGESSEDEDVEDARLNGIAEVQDMIRKLVKLGVDVNQKDNLGRTPLHYAAVFCCCAIDTLIELDADQNAWDKDHRTPLSYACNAPGSQSDSFRSESVEKLLNNSTKPGSLWNPIMLNACASAGRMDNDTKNDDKIADLIGKMADIGRNGISHFLSEVDSDQNSALHIACAAMNPAPLKGILSSQVPMKCFQLQNNMGETPLTVAAKAWGASKVQLVLEAILVSMDDAHFHFFRNDDEFRSGWKNKHAFKNFEQVDELALGEQELQDVNMDKPHELRLGNHDSPEVNIGEDYGSILSEYEGDFNQDLPYLAYGQLEAPVATQRKPTHEDLAQCLNMRDITGWTALHYAAARGSEKDVEALVNQPLVWIGPAKGCCIPSALDLAYKSQNANCVNLIRNAIRERKAKAGVTKPDSQPSSDVTKKVDDIQDFKMRSQPKRLDDFLQAIQRFEVRVAVALCAILFLWVRLRDQPVTEVGTSL